MLSVNVKYFGMVGEVTKKDNEKLNFNESVSVEELKNVILKKHPKLKKLDFQIALNLTIVDKDKKINNNDEIALLPPFAGG